MEREITMNNYRINPGDIPTNESYQGYLWISDKDWPEVFQDKSLPAWPDETTNPFIVEGNLYDEKNKLSYLIRFIDGVYHVYRFDLMQMSEKEFISKSYLPNRFPTNIHKLCFREYWEPEQDKFCEKMEVLKPTITAFTGFKYQEDKS